MSRPRHGVSALPPHGVSALPPLPRPDWQLAPEGELGAPATLARELSLPEALCRVLVARGITAPDEARAFLRPLLEHLHPPEALTDANRAADRILQAVDRGETILVHGDYDVDGVAAAALLTLWIRELGGRAVPFVPHRLHDGYDLGPAGLEAATRAGAALIVTCDSGTTAVEAVQDARQRGIDVVVTDHHTPGPALPPAVAVVNPSRSDCDYPFPRLAGVGVVFKLCQLLGRKRGRAPEALLPFLDLVALATVADLVPLRGENRVLVRFGLRALARTRRPGLRALMEVAGVQADDVDAGKVGFVLAPRINAAGRLGAADLALRLLLTDDPDEARPLALELDRLNEERQQEDRRTLDEALELLSRDYDPRAHFGVVLAREGWHPGVIGIVASRVVERIYRPTVLLAVGEGRARGSARSIPDVHLYDAVHGCREHLRRFGGHRQAAGMDVDPDRIDLFRQTFNEQVRTQLGGKPPRPALRGDASLRLGEATDELHHYLRYVGPFGIGNPRPVFWTRGATLPAQPRTVGRGHLKMRLRADGGELDAIGFGLAERVAPEGLAGGPVDALFQLRENEYRGVRALQARLLDVRPSENGPAPIRR